MADNFEHLRCKGDVTLEQKWQQRRTEWISSAMHPVQASPDAAEVVLRRVRHHKAAHYRRAFWVNSSRIGARAAARATLPYRKCRLEWQLLGAAASEDRFETPTALLTPDTTRSCFGSYSETKLSMDDPRE